MAASPLPSQGPQRGRNCYATPALSEVPYANRRGKIRYGYLTPIPLGAQKRAELLCNPCIVGGLQRQTQGKNQKWLPHPYVLGGPEEAGIAT